MGKNVRQKEMKKHWSPMFAIAFTFLILYVLVLFLPLFWGLLTSLKSDFDFRNNVFGLPKVWVFQNFGTALFGFFVDIDSAGSIRNVYMTEQFGYSLLYAAGCAFFATYAPCHVAYLTAKFRYKFSRILTTVVIVCITLPIIGSLPSEVYFAKSLGLYDRVWGMWIMKAHFLSIYFFIFQGMFHGVPDDFAEAARIDGASYLSVYLRIMIPLVSKTFLTVYILNFIGFWNDYQTPLIFMPNKPTVAYGLFLFNLKTETVLSTIPLKLAGSVLVMLPVIVLFLIFQKRLMGNSAIGGLKV